MAGNVTEITDGNFSDHVGGSDKLFLLDFWATWCGPCKALAPIVAELADEMGEILDVGKLDIDSSPSTPAQFGVRSIPTLVLFKNGQPVDQIVGNQPKAKIEEMIQRHK